MMKRISMADEVSRNLRSVEKQEARLLQMIAHAQRSSLEEKIPPKVRCGLEAAFTKAFSIMFGPGGRRLIERCYDKERRYLDYCVRDYAVRLKGGRREFRQMYRTARQSGLWNLVLTTAEGAGLGVLGIGLPDVMIFLGVLLKGIYETAVDYGFDYETPSGQMLILKMMEASLGCGERRVSLESEIDRLLDGSEICPAEVQTQIQRTAKALASDMLLLKFIQGLPVVGVVGGMGNSLYYHRILRYVQLKYWKGYLLRCREYEGIEAVCISYSGGGN